MSELYRVIEKRGRNLPGPGQYFTENNNKSKQLPSFGTKEQRQLRLINEDEIASVPGPGKYDVLPFNLDDLIRQCEDKKLVKEILQNL